MEKNSKLINRLRKNSLIDLLFTIKGNPKILILLEPLWGIPFYLINPYASLYMRENGLSKVEIGLLQSVFMISQVIIGLFAGSLADKYGRKKTTVFGNVIKLRNTARKRAYLKQIGPFFVRKD